MTRRRSLRSPEILAVTVLALAAAVFLVFGMLQHRAAAAEAPTVTIDNYMFMPQDLTIPVGGSITWVNHDSDIHSVAADDGSPVMFKSPGLDTDDKFTFTFTKAGTYLYHCTLHPHMTGKIVVQ
jgi:plastocyanin